MGQVEVDMFMNSKLIKNAVYTAILTLISYLVLTNFIDRIIKLPFVRQYCWSLHSLSSWEWNSLICEPEPTMLSVLVVLVILITLFIFWHKVLNYILSVLRK